MVNGIMMASPGLGINEVGWACNAYARPFPSRTSLQGFLPLAAPTVEQLPLVGHILLGFLVDRLVHELAEPLHYRILGRVEDLHALLAAGHQPRLDQHPEVLRDVGLVPAP